jgi:DNA polymerase-3 subunit gamma/tau
VTYVSLYRKYRPQTFTEVVGQEHVTRTIVNALDEDRLHHAYLFTGPRGTGKTSTARILAKSINCEQGPTSTPCNVCRQCVEITNGSSVDVIELDMASHGGVDDARELRDRALFAPASAAKKVYILDEVHMASTAAFNALLKLIEEPPAHVIFAMATTDPQKVLPTIMSRVQRLDLRRVPAAAVAAHIEDIVAREGATIDAAAIEAIVRAGDGSVRDTLSVLEQVLSFCGGKITGEQVIEVLGHTPRERSEAMVDAAAAGDLALALGLVQTLLTEGADLRRFAFDLLQHLRDLLVLQVAPDRPDLVDATDETRAKLQAQAGRVPRTLLVDAIDLLATAVTEMRLGPPRLPLELVLAKLTTSRGDAAPQPAPRATEPAPPPEPAPEGATAEPAPEPTPEPAEEPAEEPPPPTPSRPDELSARAKARAAKVASEGMPEPQSDRPSGPEVEVAAPPTPDESDGLATIRKHWDAILELVKTAGPRYHAIFQPGQPAFLRNRVLTLQYPPRYRSFHAENAKKGEYAEALVSAVERSCGLQVRIDTMVAGDDKPRPSLPAVDTVLAQSPPPAPADEQDVREAEESSDDVPEDEALDRASTLLETRLGAQRAEEDDLPAQS